MAVTISCDFCLWHNPDLPRPGETAAQGQHRVAVERGNMVEAGAEDCRHMRYPAPELIINHQRRRGECAIVRINAEVGSVLEA